MAGKRNENIKLFFSENEEKIIVNAIKNAELKSSAEYVVHLIESSKKTAIIEKAKELFFSLGLDKSENKNAVLILLSLKDHQFAILGDDGINKYLETNYWTKQSDLLKTYFIKNEFAEGIETVLKNIGSEMAKHYPRDNDDKNEFHDGLSF